MTLLIAFIAVVMASLGCMPFVPAKGKSTIAILAIASCSFISSSFATQAIGGGCLEFIFPGSFVTGLIPIRIDALSAWFIFLINFTFITGALCGAGYMKVYQEQKSNLTLHWSCFILVHASLLSICVIQNSIAFLIAWEIMAISAFILVIFEHHKAETLRAGINYLIQSHISILFLTIGFIWVASRLHSFDFLSITAFSEQAPPRSGIALFLCLFIGFAIKAGFVPFHTWLPHAHPAAPSHVSGVMSGVIIKIGIYGILRMFLLIKGDHYVMGYFVLIISVISGVYGVMLAILQHNLKKLLAYHSIENIGIIGIGIGLGGIGLGSNNSMMTVLGFGGALLHTLNHSLFKSLLFFSTGNVYQSTHRIIIDQLGGLVKRMPHTAILFLIASLAICGLPPFNGFISEFLIYSGIFKGMNGQNSSIPFILIFSVLGLTLIGGLALLCFTKAFGIVFLGSARTQALNQARDPDLPNLFPLYAIAVLIIGIGLFPQYVIRWLSAPVGLFTPHTEGCSLPILSPFTVTMTHIGYASLGFMALVGIVFALRRLCTSGKVPAIDATWNCAYAVPNARLQYTASSFVRSYAKLAGPLFSIYKHKKEVEGIFPGKAIHHSHSEDKIEEWMITFPMTQMRHLLNRLSFLQNGNPQMYILYGLLFISLVLLIPVLYESIHSFIYFLNHL